MNVEGVGHGARGEPGDADPQVAVHETPDSLDPNTRIGVEVGPERAVPREGFAPVVTNEEWEDYVWPVDPPRWCVRRGGIFPRLHRLEHFVMFDPGLPRYRRCPRCGCTMYLMRGKG